MNRRTFTCLLAAATLAACGQPPSPGTPQPVSTTEVTTTAETTNVAPPPATTTTTPPKPPPPPPPPRTTTTTAKPPPPPPKPPDRWVLPSGLRKSIEEQDEQLFPVTWEGIKTLLAQECPGEVPCVDYTLVTVPAADDLENCFIVTDGISIPDPLHEGGKITFRITNDLCSEG